MTFEPKTKELVESLIKQGYSVFIESGTFHGLTTAWACKRFEEVYSCEPSSALYGNAAGNLKSYDNLVLSNKPSVTFFKQFLLDLVKQQKRCVFFLDGHYSGAPCYGKNDPEGECPVIEEIETINSFKLLEPVIIIDDLGAFAFEPHPRHNKEQWPSLNKVIETTKQCEHENKFIRVDYTDDTILIWTSKEPKVETIKKT